MEFRQKKIRASFSPITSSGGTTTLVASSNQYQNVSGVLTHSIKLPNATTMDKTGLAFNMVNGSTGAVTILLNDNSTLTTLAAGQGAFFILTNKGTTNGTWRVKTGISGKAGGIGSSGPGATISAAARALFAGGTSQSNVIDTYVFATRGNAASFGTLIAGRDALDGNTMSSQTRSFVGGGGLPSVTATIEYVTFGTSGSSSNFGNLLTANENLCALSNATRGLFIAGYNGSSKLSGIEYITMASAANSLTFGTVASGGHRDSMGFASPTRGVFGGDTAGGATGTQIDYITIASLGNSASFAAMTIGKGACASGGNGVKGLFGGGEGTAVRQEIDLVFISNQVAAQNFGSLSTTRRYAAGAASQITFTINGGTNGGDVTTIEGVSFASGGIAKFFGNLTVARNQSSGTSNAHGGLF